MFLAIDTIIAFSPRMKNGIEEGSKPGRKPLVVGLSVTTESSLASEMDAVVLRVKTFYQEGCDPRLLRGEGALKMTNPHRRPCRRPCHRPAVFHLNTQSLQGDYVFFPKKTRNLLFQSKKSSPLNLLALQSGGLGQPQFNPSHIQDVCLCRQQPWRNYLCLTKTQFP